MRHPFKLKSVYENYEKTDNFVTNFKMQFRECLDYIWYETDKIKPMKTKKLPGIKELQRSVLQIQFEAS